VSPLQPNMYDLYSSCAGLHEGSLWSFRDVCPKVILVLDLCSETLHSMHDWVLNPRMSGRQCHPNWTLSCTASQIYLFTSTVALHLSTTIASISSVLSKLLEIPNQIPGGDVLFFVNLPSFEASSPQRALDGDMRCPDVLYWCCPQLEGRSSSPATL
jgi:hypothetical protein